jgi:phage protein D
MSQRDEFDTLAPEFKIRINGAALPESASVDLISVHVLEDVDAMSMFTMTMAGWDSTEMKPKYIDDDQFREGNPVEVEIGYRDQNQQVFSGEITGLEPEYLEAKPPTLTVRGYDRRHRLMRERKTRSFTNIRDSDIASQLAGDAGLSPDVEQTQPVLSYVLQHNQTDLAFLVTRALRLDFEVVVTDRSLMFRKRRIKETECLTLRREIELLEFRPRMTTLGQVQQLEVRGWDPHKKEEITARAVAGDEPSLMGGAVSGPENVGQVFSRTGSTLVDWPVQDQEDAEQVARQRFSEMALGYVQGDGICIGDPRLRAGRTVKVEGLGRRFSGLYYVPWVEHSFSPGTGYRTAFGVRRNAT